MGRALVTTPRVERPGLYYPKLPATWWLSRPNYVRFMIREVTSVFVAAFLVVLLIQLHRLGQGPEAYAAWLAKLRSPGWVLFHVVALAFAVYHSITWFNLTGVVQVVRIGERQVPPSLIAGGAFAGWAVVSLVILLFFLLRG
jgi:fumarate reductase subunit C